MFGAWGRGLGAIVRADVRVCLAGGGRCYQSGSVFSSCCFVPAVGPGGFALGVSSSLRVVLADRFAFRVWCVGQGFSWLQFRQLFAVKKGLLQAPMWSVLQWVKENPIMYMS